jgi:pimeloyl-ACP methyl ester carboxylesterase
MAMARHLYRRLAYNPETLARAFVDPAHIPSGMRSSLDDPAHPRVARFTAILIEGDGAPEPGVRPLLLWGEGDRLPGTSIEAARRLQAKLPGSVLRTVPGAGHFPQVEQPIRFVEELERWCQQPASG